MHAAVWKPAASCVETLGFTILEGNSETGESVAGVYYPMVRQMAENLGLEVAPFWVRREPISLPPPSLRCVDLGAFSCWRILATVPRRLNP